MEKTKYIIGNLGKKWKDAKNRVFHEFYRLDKSWEENLDLRPDGISKDHWASFLEHRLSEEAKKISRRNTANRSKQTAPHTLGSKTLARKKHELEAKTGRVFGRGEMYHISHRKRDGSFVNEDAQKKSEDLAKEIASGCSDNEAFLKVFGKEHPGYVRTMGFGVCPSQVLGLSSRERGASDGPTRAEHDNLKLQVQQLQEQLSFFIAQGNKMPPNLTTDLESPTGARPSSSASHAPN